MVALLLQDTNLSIAMGGRMGLEDPPCASWLFREARRRPERTPIYAWARSGINAPCRRATRSRNAHARPSTRPGGRPTINVPSRRQIPTYLPPQTLHRYWRLRGWRGPAGLVHVRTQAVGIPGASAGWTPGGSWLTNGVTLAAYARRRRDRPKDQKAHMHALSVAPAPSRIACRHPGFTPGALMARESGCRRQ